MAIHGHILFNYPLEEVLVIDLDNAKLAGPTDVIKMLPETLYKQFRSNLTKIMQKGTLLAFVTC